MSEVSRPDRLQIMLNPEEIRALDDWRFARRMPSRAAAVRELLRLGLGVGGPYSDTEGRHSTHFGVLAETQAEPSGNDRKGRTSRAGATQPKQRGARA
jgi:hypothetical protein